MEDKLKAYLGFAKRAGKLVLGVNAVKSVRGKIDLLLLDRSAAENTRKEIAGLVKRFCCPLLEVDGLEDLTCKANCKLAAVREEHLAAAIRAVLTAGED